MMLPSETCKYMVVFPIMHICYVKCNIRIYNLLMDRVKNAISGVTWDILTLNIVPHEQVAINKLFESLGFTEKQKLNMLKELLK